MISCSECMLKPVCRQKDFHTMVTECSIVYYELFIENSTGFPDFIRSKDFDKRIIELYDELKPVLWTITNNKSPAFKMVILVQSSNPIKKESR